MVLPASHPSATSESRKPISASSQLSPSLSDIVNAFSTYFFLPPLPSASSASTFSVYDFPIFPMKTLPPHSAFSANGLKVIGYSLLFFSSMSMLFYAKLIQKRETTLPVSPSAPKTSTHVSARDGHIPLSAHAARSHRKEYRHRYRRF